MNKKQLGLLGSAMLFIGVFLPLFSVPIVGDVNYIQDGSGDGAVVLVLSAVSLMLVLAGKYIWLQFTSIISFLWYVITYFRFRLHLSEIIKESEGGFLEGITETAIQSIQMQWGWAVLIIGSVLLLLLSFESVSIVDNWELPETRESDCNNAGFAVQNNASHERDAFKGVFYLLILIGVIVFFVYLSK